LTAKKGGTQNGKTTEKTYQLRGGLDVEPPGPSIQEIIPEKNRQSGGEGKAGVTDGGGPRKGGVAAKWKKKYKHSPWQIQLAEKVSTRAQENRA